jgi:hypothetical protein
MSLNKPQLKAGIKTIQDTLYASINLTPDQAREQFATGLADLIDQFVKSGTVNVTVTVTTTGTAAAQSGGGTGTGGVT